MAAPDGQAPQQSDADRFVAAMRTIMSPSPETVADLRARRINPPDATVRIKESQVVRGTIGLVALREP